MPAPERGDTSYVTILFECTHEQRVPRTVKPTLKTSVYCFECKTRRFPVKVLDDLEWVVRCTECRYGERCNKSEMKARRRAANHYNRRRHAVRVFHESDPNGTEKWYRDKDWREDAQRQIERHRSGISDDEPPF